MLVNGPNLNVSDPRITGSLISCDLSLWNSIGKFLLDASYHLLAVFSVGPALFCHIIEVVFMRAEEQV